MIVLGVCLLALVEGMRLEVVGPFPSRAPPLRLEKDHAVICPAVEPQARGEARLGTLLRILEPQGLAARPGMPPRGFWGEGGTPSPTTPKNLSHHLSFTQ